MSQLSQPVKRADDARAGALLTVASGDAEVHGLLAAGPVVQAKLPGPAR